MHPDIIMPYISKRAANERGVTNSKADKMKIHVTRKYFGRDHKMLIGNHEHEGDGALETYELPTRYTLSDGSVYDPSGWMVEMIATPKGMTLMSLAGPEPDVHLTPVTAT